MTAFPTTAQLEAPRKTRLPGASHYEIDEFGFVYRRDRKLRLQNRNGKWFAQVYTDNGTRWSFDTERIVEELFGQPDEELTRADVEDTIGARRVPEYPRYAVTYYGAVYCIDPPKRGPNAGKIYLLQEILRNDIPYVTLTRANNSRAPTRVSDIVDSAW